MSGHRRTTVLSGDAPGRHYRVIKRMPWIEGGKPAPPPEWWEGGELVVYEPGDIVYMEDQDVKGTYFYLEPIDDAGRGILEEARPNKVQIIPVADFTPNDVEFLTRAFEQKRRVYGCVPEYAVYRDGSKRLVRWVPTKPLPGVVHGDDGLPDPWATARQRKRQEEERKLARIEAGAERGRRTSRENKRADAAQAGEELLSAVRAYRAKHPNHGGPAIAAALVDQHGKILDHADPRCREKAIEALRRRIARLEKSLDT